MRDIFAEFEKMENEEIAEKMKNTTPTPAPAPANAKYSPEPEPDNTPAPGDEPEPTNETPAETPAEKEV